MRDLLPDLVTLRGSVATLEARVLVLEAKLAPRSAAPLQVIAETTKALPFQLWELWDLATLEPALATALLSWDAQRLGKALRRAEGRPGAYVVTREQVLRDGIVWRVIAR